MNKCICELHNKEVTNFCLDRDCLEGLCPECLTGHYKVHSIKNNYPDLFTLDGLVN